jgi:hypothetical protein
LPVHRVTLLGLRGIEIRADPRPASSDAIWPGHDTFSLIFLVFIPYNPFISFEEFVRALVCLGGVKRCEDARTLTSLRARRRPSEIVLRKIGAAKIPCERSR